VSLEFILEVSTLQMPLQPEMGGKNYPVLQHCILEGKPLLLFESLKPCIMYELITVCEKLVFIQSRELQVALH
jgi:hypothetical protein